MNFSFLYIQNNEELRDFMDHFHKRQPTILFVDTEFTRRTTYWPILELLQISLGDPTVFIIDMQAITNYEVLIEPLTNPHIVKVFHSGRQDIEGIWHHTGCIPCPIFDTQIAAAFLGYGLSIGLNDLVSLLLTYEMNKKEQYSDWQMRPLRKEQLLYAAQDVVVLEKTYNILKDNLHVLGREEWVKESMTSLEDPKKIVMNPQNSWMRLKNQVTTHHSLYFLTYLSALREQIAQELNIHKGRVFTDADLISLCEALVLFVKISPVPELTWQTLLQLHPFTLPATRHSDFLSLCYKIIKAYPNRCIKHYKQMSDRQIQFSHTQHQEYLSIKAFVQKKSQDLVVPSALLAPNSMIEDYVVHKTPDHSLISGWREPIFKNYINSQCIIPLIDES